MSFLDNTADFFGQVFEGLDDLVGFAGEAFGVVATAQGLFNAPPQSPQPQGGGGFANTAPVAFADSGANAGASSVAGSNSAGISNTTLLLVFGIAALAVFLIAKG